MIPLDEKFQKNTHDRCIASVNDHHVDDLGSINAQPLLLLNSFCRLEARMKVVRNRSKLLLLVVALFIVAVSVLAEDALPAVEEGLVSANGAHHHRRVEGHQRQYVDRSFLFPKLSPEEKKVFMESNSRNWNSRRNLRRKIEVGL